MKRFKSGTLFIITALFALICVLGTVFCEYHADMQTTHGHSAEEIEEIPIEPVNINTASAEELSEVPGLTATLARRVVAYREEHGGFGTVGELENVNGITRETVASIEIYLTTE